jgi:hypothetical protein
LLILTCKGPKSALTKRKPFFLHSDYQFLSLNNIFSAVKLVLMSRADRGDTDLDDDEVEDFIQVEIEEDNGDYLSQSDTDYDPDSASLSPFSSIFSSSTLSPPASEHTLEHFRAASPVPTRRGGKCHVRRVKVRRVKDTATEEDLSNIYHHFTLTRPSVEVGLPVWIPDKIPDKVKSPKRTVPDSAKTSVRVLDKRIREALSLPGVESIISNSDLKEVAKAIRIAKSCFTIDAREPGMKSTHFPWLYDDEN